MTFARIKEVGMLFTTGQTRGWSVLCVGSISITCLVAVFARLTVRHLDWGSTDDAYSALLQALQNTLMSEPVVNQAQHAVAVSISHLLHSCLHLSLCTRANWLWPVCGGPAFGDM